MQDVKKQWSNEEAKISLFIDEDIRAWYNDRLYGINSSNAVQWSNEEAKLSSFIENVRAWYDDYIDTINSSKEMQWTINKQAQWELDT